MFRAVILAFFGLALCQDDLTSLISQAFPDASKSATEKLNLQPSKSSLPPKENCECVAYYLCSNNTINKDGFGIIDIRIQDGPCANVLETCCEDGAKVDKPILPSRLSGSDKNSHPENIFTGSPNISASNNYVSRGCGYRNPQGVGFRITGDEDQEAQFGEFPWMAAIITEISEENRQLKYICGGSLIHPSVVLTAAHCIEKAKGKPLKVRIGEWDTKITNEILGHQEREVVKVLIHPHYYAGALFNDYALLTLNEPIELQENADLICLPPAGTVFDQKNCFASGWGKGAFTAEAKYQEILKRVPLNIVPNAKCVEALRKTRLGVYFELDKSFICAGGEPGKDTCKGDGGSPLVCPIPGQAGRYYQAGIVAWGIGCGENNVPGVYANVAYQRNWIDEQMQYERFDTNKYNY